MTNLEIAALLRKVAAAYLILGENRFKIIAYERAADSVEHLTGNVKDYWNDNKLDQIPGIGGGIGSNLDELFRTGKSTFWEDVLSKVPQTVFPLLLVPGIGPKKAFTLVTKLKLTREKNVIDDLIKAGKANKIAALEGFGEQSQSVILSAIATYKRGAIKENRMPLPIADSIAQDVISYLQNISSVLRTDVLGSLRRQVATIGDIDIAVSTNNAEAVLDHFLTYPHQRIIDRGKSGATLLLHNGRQVDLRVQTPDKYGAMLQYFTGSKHHNIALRERALSKGLSLSEHGLKQSKTGKTTFYKTEEALYKAIGFPYIPPELREDKGELDGALPILVETNNIRGDLHVHSNYDLKPSHDHGRDSIQDMQKKAISLGYEYIGFSDHNPKLSGLTDTQRVHIMKKRRDVYDSYASHGLGVFVMCEVDIQPDGSLALPKEAFDYVDAVIVSIHSVFTQQKEIVTDRIIQAMTSHPKVRILGHPTGRLLGRREGVNTDWPKIFDVAKKYDIALEINAYPDRLDLPDTLVFDARKTGVRFCVNTDSHAQEHMDLMRYGVSVARRGWCTKRDIVNTMGYTEFRRWLCK